MAKHCLVFEMVFKRALLEGAILNCSVHLASWQHQLECSTAVTELLVARLYHDAANGAPNPGAVEITGKRLFGGVVVPQLAFTVNFFTLARHPKAIGVAMRRIVGRRHHYIEVDGIGIPGLNRCGNYVGMLV